MASPSCALRILSSLLLDIIRALRFTASLLPPPAALRRFTRSRSACRKFDFSTHYNKRTSPKRDLFFYGRGRETRTPGTRFWRPLLYQLSYTPILQLVNYIMYFIFCQALIFFNIVLKL